jgi:hypothetical protein
VTLSPVSACGWGAADAKDHLGLLADGSKIRIWRFVIVADDQYAIEVLKSPWSHDLIGSKGGGELPVSIGIPYVKTREAALLYQAMKKETVFWSFTQKKPREFGAIFTLRCHAPQPQILFRIAASRRQIQKARGHLYQYVQVAKMRHSSLLRYLLHRLKPLTIPHYAC